MWWDALYLNGRLEMLLLFCGKKVKGEDLVCGLRSAGFFFFSSCFFAFFCLLLSCTSAAVGSGVGLSAVCCIGPWISMAIQSPAWNNGYSMRGQFWISISRKYSPHGYNLPALARYDLAFFPSAFSQE